MTEQGYSGDRHPPMPPARPVVATGVGPLQAAAQPRPRGIDVSYWLWLGACLIGVLTATATLRYFDQLQAELLLIVEQEFPGETPATRDEVAMAAVAILIGAGVLVALAQTAFAITMYSGRGWARFVLVLLALLGWVYGLSVFSAAPTVTKVGLVTSAALMVVAVVLMFPAGARRWFAQRSLARSGYEYGE